MICTGGSMYVVAEMSNKGLERHLVGPFETESQAEEFKNKVNDALEWSGWSDTMWVIVLPLNDPDTWLNDLHKSLRL